jgi:hypothetical protein
VGSMWIEMMYMNFRTSSGRTALLLASAAATSIRALAKMLNFAV